MKFVDLLLSDSKTTISINPEKVAFVKEIAREGFVDLGTGDDIFLVKGTRAEAVAKLEAATELPKNRTEQSITIPTLSGKIWIPDPRCKDCNTNCPYPNNCKGRWGHADASREKK